MLYVILLGFSGSSLIDIFWTSSLFSSRSRQKCHKDAGVKLEWHFDLLRKSALTEDDLKVILFPQLKKNCGSGHFGKVERFAMGTNR